MQKFIRTALYLIVLFYTCSGTAKSHCAQSYLATHPQAILACYLDIAESSQPAWVIEMDDHDPRGVAIETYQLNSQQWPKPEMSQHVTVWKHRLVIYRPDVVSSHQALLFVNGGTPIAFNKHDISPLTQIDFARIAVATQSIVAELQDVPEQVLTLDDNVPRKEDNLVAYSWARYLKNPASNPYWPIQIPMTKAVVKAMDAVQQIVAQADNFEINHFVVSGVSKRGEAVWLAALADARINAIVPIVINTVNIQPLLNKTYQSYNNHWPEAFHDYVAQQIPDQIHKPEFAQLLKIIDPFAYLNCQNCEAYKKRLSIPKYIINASGDDFFVPDSLNNYLDKLPGENLVRIAPNEGHALNNQLIEDSLLAYYESLIYQIPHPHVQWTLAKSTGTLQTVSVDAIPVSATLWEAENSEARDFRYSRHIIYNSKKITSHCTTGRCEYTMTINLPKKGFKADFVELTYEFTNGDNLVLTTPAYITSADYHPVADPNPPIKKIRRSPKKIAVKTPEPEPIAATTPQEGEKDARHWYF
jgi:PhoPQ-activated pathogenicity-related protein